MDALILVDLQNDFTPATDQKPEGALAVPGGNEVVEVANRVMPRFELVVATQDWHPPDHKSFASQHPGHQFGDVITWRGLEQILWPDHCVQGTRGAALLPGLDKSRVQHVIRKGTDPEIDSYSGFFDNGHRKATGLDLYLRNQGVENVYLMGLATDVCVKFTALDARQLGYETYLIEDGCRGVNLKAGDVDRALAEMREAGVHVLQSQDLLAQR